MALPDVFVTIPDGALGLQSNASDGVHVKLGVCAGGTANTLYSHTSVKQLVADLVGGPAVEAAAFSLQVAGGTVITVPVNASVTGSVGTVTESGTGPLITLTGSPADAYEPIVRIVTGGAVGTATFQYALDSNNPAGPSWSAVLATASTYAISGTGMTIGFPTGTYVASTSYTAPVTAPGYTSTDLTNAMTALLADPREWGFVHVVGQASSATASYTLGAVIDSLMTSAQNNYRFARAVFDAANDTDTNLLTAFANASWLRTAASAGTEEITSPITGRVQTRPAGWSFAARAARVLASEDPAKVRLGGLRGVVKINRDEQATPALDAGRFITLRTLIGQPGFFITNSNLMAPPGSDFKYWQLGRVMDVACKTARDALLFYLNDNVRMTATGTINELDARALEAFVGGKLDARLTQQGEASSVSLQVDRAANLLSTGVLNVTVRIVPLGEIHSIALNIGFLNPALLPKAA